MKRLLLVISVVFLVSCSGGFSQVSNDVTDYRAVGVHPGVSSCVNCHAAIEPYPLVGFDGSIAVDDSAPGNTGKVDAGVSRLHDALNK